MRRHSARAFLIGAAGTWLLCLPVLADAPAAKDLEQALERARAMNKEYTFAEARTAYQEALKQALLVHGPKATATASLMTESAAVYRELGEYQKAETLLNDSLKIQEAKLGKDHIAVARTLRELAFLYVESGQSAKAAPLAERATKIHEAAKDEIELAESLYIQAIAVSFTGRGDDAEPLFARSVRIFEERLGKEHVRTARALTFLGLHYWYCEQSAKAMEPLQRALRITEKHFGVKHFELARPLLYLARVYQKMRKLPEAAATLERCLELRNTYYGKEHPKVVQVLDALGNLYTTQHDFDKAETFFRRSLELRAKIYGEDHPEVGWGLQHLAFLYSHRGEYAKAIPLLKRACTIMETRGDPRGLELAEMLDGLATAYKDQSVYEEAEPLYRRVLDLREKALGKDHLDVAKVLHNLAIVYSQTDRPSDAAPLFRRSLAIIEARLGKEHIFVTYPLESLGIVLNHTAQFVEGEKCFQRCLEIKEKFYGKDHPDVALTLFNFGTMHSNRGQPQRATALYRRCLDIYEAKLGKEHPKVADTLELLADNYRRMGQPEKTEAMLERAMAIRAATFGSDHSKVAVTLMRLGFLQAELGKYDQAKASYLRGVDIYEKRWGKDHPDVGYALGELAALHLTLKEPEPAEEYARRSLGILEARFGKEHRSVGVPLFSLARLYQNHGPREKAEPLYLRCLAIAEKNNRGELRYIWRNLASLYRDTGQPTKAAPLYRKCLDEIGTTLGADHRAAAEIHNYLGILHAMEKDAPAAVLAFAEGRKIVRRYAVRLLPYLAPADQLAFLKAQDEESFHAALSLGVIQADTERARHIAGWLLNAKGVAQEALSHRTLLEQQAIETTDAALRDRIRELQDVRSRQASLRLAAPERGKEEAQALELRQLAGRQQQLERAIVEAGGRPADRAEPWIEPDEVRKTLPTGSVLIDLARFRVRNFNPRADVKNEWQEPHFAALLIPPTGKGDIQLIDLGDADKIEEAIKKARRAMQTPPPRGREAEHEKEMRPALEKLARLVLQPLAEHLDKYERWLISPDASLWLVPWGALPLKDGKYAIERHTIGYLVSGRDLVEPGYKSETGAPLVLADPDYDLEQKTDGPSSPAPVALRGEVLRSGDLGRTRWSRLPGTAAEAKAIAPKLEAFAKAKPQVFTDKQALESVFKSTRRPKVLVLSTHGFFLDDQDDALVPSGGRGLDFAEAPISRPRPKDGQAKVMENPLLRCGLVLAGANQRDKTPPSSPPSQGGAGGGDDGILTGLEIVGTDLRGTELVVLSACETGLGTVHNGEGVAGLRQAFQLAGARAVVATLWQIPDAETAQLMTGFFDNLAKGQSKADALRGAQLAQIKERRAKNGAAHPFYWAAFTLTGQ